MLALAATCVNDVHSRLNPTRVAKIRQPRDVDELRSVVLDAANEQLHISICGGRHAMGGQQFGTDTMLIDMKQMTRCLDFDKHAGHVEIEAGADWRDVIRATHDAQAGDRKPWGIRQKQTGADCLSLGGAVSANVHGRGLNMRPFVDDIESLQLVTPDAQVVRCSRTQHVELFRLVVGGYGLFGIVASVTLRLGPRQKLRRLVDVLDIDEALPAIRRRASAGCVYGDFQYAIDSSDESFLRRGVCACYEPVAADVPISDQSADLSCDDWVRLLRLAHTDKRRAFEVYSAHYLSTHGRIYWSDTMQLSTYLPSYEQFLKDTPGCRMDESLIIGELYVPPDGLLDFLYQARQTLRRRSVEDIYGTIRWIKRDPVTFLPWARRDYACVIFNLRTSHDQPGIERTAGAFGELQDHAIALGGSFYLTYHRFATAAQIEACYPRFRQFLQIKREYDPDELFSSDWYGHCRHLFH